MDGSSGYGNYTMADGQVEARNRDSHRPSENIRQYIEYLSAQSGAVVDTNIDAFEPVPEGDASKELQGNSRVDTSYSFPTHVHAAPSTPAGRRSVLNSHPAPFQQASLPSPNRLKVPRLRYSSAFEAQMGHQWQPCWRPIPGSLGVPLADDEQAPHVMRLFAAFIDTRIVADSSKYAVQFQPGGIWTQGQDDIELTCWNLVQTAVNLHVVGAVGLQFRQMPETLPAPGSLDAALTFALRIYCLELLIRHFKVFAHRMMLQKDVEFTFAHVHSILWEKYRFKDVMRAMAPPQRAEIDAEWARRLSLAPPQTAQSSAAGSDNGRQQHKRSFSATSPTFESATQPAAKRANRMTTTPSASTAPSPRLCSLLAFPNSPFLNNPATHTPPPETRAPPPPDQHTVPVADETQALFYGYAPANDFIDSTMPPVSNPQESAGESLPEFTWADWLDVHEADGL